MRVDRWENRLLEIIDEWKSRPFEWAVNDCCVFAARCVDVITGSDWVGDLGQCYHDKASAYAYIAAEGSIEASVTKRLGDPVPRLLARRGDACLVDTPDGPGVAVCVGSVALIPGPNGLISKPLRSVIKAWRVD